MKTPGKTQHMAMLLISTLIVFTFLVKVNLLEHIDQAVYNALYVGENVLVVLISETASIYTSMMLVFLWILIDYAKRRRFTSTSVKLLILMIITLLLTYGLKMILKVPRPGAIYINLPNGFLEELELYSYPSGHSARAIALSIFILNTYRGKFFSILICIWALTICITRILLGVHWFSDVIGGLITGILAFYLSEITYNHIVRKVSRVLRNNYI